MNLKKISPWLDALAILAWGILLLKYWITGKLSILIHPNYFGLTLAGGIGLMVIGGLKTWELIKLDRTTKQSRTSAANNSLRITEVEHVTLFPPSIGSTLMLSVALIGLLTTPRTFTSQTALERGLTESLPITRLQPQEFRNSTKPELRSLVEWVRLLNFNPEPDTYRGQKVKVQGFVIHPPNITEQYVDRAFYHYLLRGRRLSDRVAGKITDRSKPGHLCPRQLARNRRRNDRRRTARQAQINHSSILPQTNSRTKKSL